MSEIVSNYSESTITGVSQTVRRKVINVETSTLYQLKSEIATKSSEIHDLRSKLGNFKAPMVSRKLLPEHLKAKKRARKEEKKNSGVNVRDEQDREKMAKDRETADKIKRKLEAKARLYDQVHNGGEDLDDYLKENCLVDFDTKEGSSRDKNSSRSSGHEKERGRERERHISYQSEQSQNNLIEHTDALGRTSYIDKQQLRDMREYDREITDLKRDDFDERSNRYSDGSRSPSPESKQARFQNLDDGDTRELGVGYFNFSGDEATRQQQMGLLDTLRHSTVETRHVKQVKETTKAEKTRKFLEKKRAKLAQLRGIKKEDIIIPDLEVIIDAPEPIPMNRTEMNIDRNIATAKKAQRDWDKEKDMDEIYGTDEGKRKPIASETQYYEKMRNERKEEFAPVYNEYEKPQSSNESDYRQQPQQQNYGFQSQSYSNEYGGNKYQDANQQGGYPQGGQQHYQGNNQQQYGGNQGYQGNNYNNQGNNWNNQY